MRWIPLAVILALTQLAGCASDPRYKYGVQWVTEQQAERARLQSQGFPQYTYD